MALGVEADYEALRREIKVLAAKLWGMRHIWLGGEVLANEMLAYRHLEDASMRLVKVMQALEGVE